MALSVAELKRRSVTGVINYAFRTGFLQLVGVVATGLLSAFLSPADFGVYFVVTSMIGLFTFMSDVGLAATLVQMKTEPSLEELRTTFTVQQVLAVLIVIISIGFTPVWQSVAHLSASGLWLLYALSFSFIMASFKTIPSILLERNLRFDKLVIPQIAETLIFYTVAVIMAMKGYGVTSYTVAVILRSLAGVVLMYRLQPWPIGVYFSKNSFQKLIGFGAKFQLNDLLARIKDDLFVVVLAKFLPATTMGYIGWAKRWSMFPYQLSVNSIVAISFSTYSRLQHDALRLAKAVEKSIFFISLVIFPILTGMSVMAWPLTELVPKLTKWQPALPSLSFFCINIAWAAVSTPLTNTLNAVGKISVTLKLMVFWTVATWIITPLAIHYFGTDGVAIASAIIATSSAFTIYLIKKMLKLSFIDQVWRQLLASGCMLAFLWYYHAFWSRSYLWFGIGVATGAVVYVTVVMLVGYNKVKAEIASLLSKPL